MIRRSLLGAVLAGAVALTGGALTAPAAWASGTSGTKVGAWSKDWAWFDSAVGPVDVYRGYDNGFHYPTWQQVPRSLAHPGGMNDYSFQLPPPTSPPAPTTPSCARSSPRRRRTS